MKTNCPHCGEEFEVEDSAFGRKANCCACGKDFIVGQVRTKIRNKGLNTATREKPSKEKGRVLWGGVLVVGSDLAWRMCWGIREVFYGMFVSSKERIFGIRARHVELNIRS